MCTWVCVWERACAHICRRYRLILPIIFQVLTISFFERDKVCYWDLICHPISLGCLSSQPFWSILLCLSSHRIASMYHLACFMPGVLRIKVSSSNLSGKTYTIWATSPAPKIWNSVISSTCFQIKLDLQCQNDA